VKIVDRFDVVLEVMKEYGNLFEYETRDITQNCHVPSATASSTY